MNKKKLLILGASGLTGYKAIRLARAKFEVFGTYNARITPDNSLIKLDLAKGDEIERLFNDIKPDVVLNATALHNVDYCESHPDEAFNINSKVVGKIADLCNRIGSRFIHISTDYVFDGSKRIFSESDEPIPLSVYGRSKLEGEHQATKCASHSILRPSVVYGWTPFETQTSSSSSGKPMNFALWALYKLNKHEELKIVNDQFTSPTLADVLAAVAIRLAGLDKNELYHVSGTSCMSRFEFTIKLAKMMGYKEDYIKPVDSSSFTQAAKRPVHSCLNSEKVQKDLNYRLLNVDESLAIMRSQIESEAPHLLGS